jgi:4-diphosphocytidyl-2C-methyl-D-erythritol kinase
LLEIAENLGSDIAFFLYDCSWALGIEKGHKIKKINSPLFKASASFSKKGQ